MEDERLLKKIKLFLTNRLFIFSFITCMLFSVLVMRLFKLQIVEAEEYEEGLKTTIVKKIPISAPRGNIYDKYGRPLAINRSAFNLNFDLSVKISPEQLNDVIFKLINIFEKNNQEYVDEFPISSEMPYTFTFESETRELSWKIDMGLDEKLTAEEVKKVKENKGYYYTLDKRLTASETIDRLTMDFIKLPKDQLSKEKKVTIEETIDYLSTEILNLPKDIARAKLRKFLSIRSAIYMQRYKAFTSITLAYDVSDEIIVGVEEQNEKFIGVYVDVQSLREYPSGKYFSHIIGYTGKLSEKNELDMYSEHGYKYTDVIGKTGLEKSFELELNGKNGTMLVEVNRYGKRTKVVEEGNAENGNDIYLTMDLKLQEAAYTILESKLTEILQNKLKVSGIKQYEFFSSMVNSNNISITKILTAEDGTYSADVKHYIYDKLKTLNNVEADIEVASNDTNIIKEIISDGLKVGNISSRQMIFVLYEQNIINIDDIELDEIKKGRISTLQVILDRLGKGEITPQMTNLSPSTGSIVVIEPKTGDLLAAVGYPSYDNNEFVNNYNIEYSNKIYNDPTIPILNRPFVETRAPGSTFKMISAIAALENGTITPSQTIQDKTSFTKAGFPYTNCWQAFSHGAINVAHALEVSCNYFFSEATYNLGNAKNSSTLTGIAALNEYMIAFGLNDRTGVEIGEYRDSREEYDMVISSPELRKKVALKIDEESKPSTYAWHDGDTVKTSIGQAENNYTAASMGKYIATLATGGERYKLHLVDRIENSKNEIIEKFEPVLETQVHVEPQNLKAVYDGMLLVTEGSRGTAKNVFRNFGVRVAGKTGTAQEFGPDHSSFGGFAPFEDPQMAIYVVIPFGDSKYTPASSSQAAKEVISEYLGLNNVLDYKEGNNSLMK
jgi:penicillin-binding protein 2